MEAIAPLLAVLQEALTPSLEDSTVVRDLKAAANNNFRTRYAKVSLFLSACVQAIVSGRPNENITKAKFCILYVHFLLNLLISCCS